MVEKRIKETSDLSYLTLLVLALMGLIIGGLVGLVDTVFGRVLIDLTAIRDKNPWYWLPFLSVAGLTIVYLYQTIGAKSAKGMGLVFQVGFEEEDTIPKRLIPMVIVTTWLTHLFGGSAGREGVAVQLGATVAHWFNRFFHFPNKSRIFLLTGMAAGFAGLYQTPMASVLFALEVLVIGNLELGALVPMTIASFTASLTSHTLGLEKFSHTLARTVSLTPTVFIQLLILGLVFGLAGNLFAYLLAWCKQLQAQLFPNPYRRIFLLGLLLSLLFLLLYQGRYSGLGTNLIAASFSGGKIYAYDWLLKLLLTVITLAAGFQGGEVTPLFAIGSSLGVLLASLFHLPIAFVAALGYISVFGSATNTYLAPILIGGEVFGYQNLPAYFIVSTFAYIVNRKHSIYTLQKISVRS
ncbi:voltage-gated chloride channel family protein [Streptococcus macacae]|uniref:Chloride transporter, ClC family n=1 Tax=Streptococcus macacae NCTC 11558 TaxID=764298 RepID=G5JYV6_9STRE|nr:voltage-gated chloride channel family protein [Streptococcus macacae]EHJ52253.1 chloride transporter, ClC family [Streptococcus macacae NCTC 11558]SUN78213.1 permease chloride channel [Streptococcus macacae NCTC 11558]